MLKAVLDSFELLVKKPALLLPAFILGAINFVLFYFLEETFIEFMFSLTESEALPASPSIVNALIQFIALNLDKVLFLLGLGVVSLFFGLWLLFVFGRFASLHFKGKGSVKEAVGFAVKRIPRIIKLLVFVLILLWFYAVVLWFALALALNVEIIGLIVLIVVLFFGGYFLLGLLLTPVVMASLELDLNQGLRKTWAFSSKHLIGILALLAVIFAISSVLEQVSWYLAGLSGSLWTEAFIGVVFFLVIVSFQSLSLALYYNSKSHGQA